MTPSARKAPPQHVVGTPVIHAGKHVQLVPATPLQAGRTSRVAHETSQPDAFMTAALERLLKIKPRDGIDRWADRMRSRD